MTLLILTVSSKGVYINEYMSFQVVVRLIFDV
jgi:hypothetical protein